MAVDSHGVAHPDLPAEQAYLDTAYDCLDRMRETLLRTAEAGATDEAKQAIFHDNVVRFYGPRLVKQQARAA